jgi:NADPH:quinone reductase
MRAISYRQTGGPEVLTLVDKPIREPGPGEVRVRIQRSAVNPTD